MEFVRPPVGLKTINVSIFKHNEYPHW